MSFGTFELLRLWLWLARSSWRIGGCFVCELNFFTLELFARDGMRLFVVMCISKDWEDGSWSNAGLWWSLLHSRPCARVDQGDVVVGLMEVFFEGVGVFVVG